MLLCTSPKCKFTHQSETISPLTKLTICTVILISSLAIVHFFLIIDHHNSTSNFEDVKSRSKIMDINSSYSSGSVTKWQPLIEDRIDNNPYHVTMLMGTDSRQDMLGDAENSAESTSESIQRGTVVMAHKDLTKFRGKNVEPMAKIVEVADIRRKSENLEEPLGANDDDEGDADRTGDVDFVTVRPTNSLGLDEANTMATKSRSQSGAAGLDAVQAGEPASDYDTQEESRHNMVDQSRRKPPSTSGDVEDRGMIDQIPESMDSLMNSNEQEDLVDVSDEKDLTPAPPAPPEAAFAHASNGKKGFQTMSSPGKRAQPRSAPMGPGKNDDDDGDDFDIDMDDRRPVAMVPRENSDEDLSAAAGHSYSKKKSHHHGDDHGKYYMYAKVPKKKTWEFGFKRGNKKHWIERHEKGHKNKFKTKVKWYDKKSKGKGVHIWDYNHHDKKKKHYG